MVSNRNMGINVCLNINGNLRRLNWRNEPLKFEQDFLKTLSILDKYKSEHALLNSLNLCRINNKEDIVVFRTWE